MHEVSKKLQASGRKTVSASLPCGLGDLLRNLFTGSHSLNKEDRSGRPSLPARHFRNTCSSPVHFQGIQGYIRSLFSSGKRPRGEEEGSRRTNTRRAVGWRPASRPRVSKNSSKNPQPPEPEPESATGGARGLGSPWRCFAGRGPRAGVGKREPT